MRFWKGQALGNDYVILEAPGDADAPAPEAVRWLCDRHLGVGGDGVLVAGAGGPPFPLRIFNPDGAEAEKSGNGLRIFGAWLHGQGRVGDAPFQVALRSETVGMRVEAVADDGSRMLRVEMGTASFRSGDLPYTGPGAPGEIMGGGLDVDGERVVVHLVSLGNPHCVLFADALDDDRFHRLAPRIQALAAFPRGVNVQLARVAGPTTLDARIHERGAGPTLASGSSACAVAAAAVRSGRARPGTLQVRMPGGAVTVEVDDAWRLRLTGPAQIVFEGRGIDARWRGLFDAG